MREINQRYAEQLELESGSGYIRIELCGCQRARVGFYIDEMSGIFLVAALLVALVAKIKPNDFINTFVEGCKDLLFAGLIIGLCNSVCPAEVPSPRTVSGIPRHFSAGFTLDTYAHIISPVQGAVPARPQMKINLHFTF